MMLQLSVLPPQSSLFTTLSSKSPLAAISLRPKKNNRNMDKSMGSSNNSSSSSSSSSRSGSSSNITTDITTTKSNHFPSRLHNMLDSAEEKGYSHIVSWCKDDGKAFKVHDPTRMIPVLQSTFRQTKYKSFLRQLQTYGFERITKGIYLGRVSHPHFQQGKHALCLQIKRKVSRTTESMSMSTPSSTSTSTSSSAMAAYAAANTIMTANMNSAFGYGHEHNSNGPNLINYAEIVKRITSSSSYHHRPSNESATRAIEIVVPMSHNNATTTVTPIQAGSLLSVVPPMTIAPPVFIPTTISHPVTIVVPTPIASSSFQECHSHSHYTNQGQDQSQDEVQAGQIQSRIHALQQEIQKRQQQQQQQQQQRSGGVLFKRERSAITTGAVVSPSTSVSSSFAHEPGSLLYSADSNPSSPSVAVVNNLLTNQQHQQHLLSLLTNDSDKAYLSPCCFPDNCAEICCTFTSFTSATSSVTDGTNSIITDNNNNVNNNNSSSILCPSSMISSNNKRQRCDDSDHPENHLLLSTITTDSNKRQRTTTHQQQQMFDFDGKQELDHRNSKTISTMSSSTSLLLSLLEPRPIRTLNSNNDNNNNNNNYNKTTTTTGDRYDCEEQQDNCLHTMMRSSNKIKQQPMYTNIPELTAPLFPLSSSTRDLLKSIDDNLGNNYYDSFFLSTNNEDLDDITAITAVDIDEGIAEFFNILDNTQ